MAKVEDTSENAEICKKYCVPCLSYPGVEGEVLFCARGKSSNSPTKNGCNCGYCEVKRNAGCSGTYFCINGACE
jgi:hypothetical protein